MIRTVFGPNNRIEVYETNKKKNEKKEEKQRAERIRRGARAHTHMCTHVDRLTTKRERNGDGVGRCTRRRWAGSRKMEPVGWRRLSISCLRISAIVPVTHYPRAPRNRSLDSAGRKNASDPCPIDRSIRPPLTHSRRHRSHLRRCFFFGICAYICCLYNNLSLIGERR